VVHPEFITVLILKKWGVKRLLNPLKNGDQLTACFHGHYQ